MFTITYKDKECGKQECHSARRSFDDLLTICRTYFPRTSKKALAKCLLQLWDSMQLGSYYCTNIGKIVFRQYPDNNITKGQHQRVYETEVDLKQHSNYSLNDIIKLQTS